MNAGTTGQESLIPLEWTKPVASCMTFIILFNIGLNLSAVWCIYNKRKLRHSSTAIIVANLAAVDILVSVKDLSAFFSVASSGNWLFDEQWCTSYGLTNVIFIIVSVSTLVTITTDRFSRLREMATTGGSKDGGGGGGAAASSQKPIILGYVIAHTTLSYSLSLLWSKYVFVTRKAFCRVEWPPRHGFGISFMSSFVFILPVSVLIYNMLHSSVFRDTPASTTTSPQLAVPNGGKKSLEEALEDATAGSTTAVGPVASYYESKAQGQLQLAVVIFLLSWTPYVAESILSSYLQISPIVGILSACIPIFSTSLLPVLFMESLRQEPPPPKSWDGIVLVQ